MSPFPGGSLTGLTFGYTYDTNGNITKVTQNGSTLATYTYDGQGQLRTETITTSTGSTTYTYTYDTAGNILSVSDGTETIEYSYENDAWQDQLTAYDGQTITYDAAGNPTTYYDGTTMTWTQGRRLAEIKNGDTTVASYTYDMSGIRTSKTVGDTTYNYITQNGQVVRQTWGDNTLDIVYDNNNQPYYCIYTPDGGTATVYYYITNLQGDVVKLVTANGAEAASYTYNAWGAVEVTNANGYTIGDINPIRYRGYYYDTESGFYYLQSRYYDPVICRFINADAPELSEMTAYSVSDSNLFAYCGNNPVMRGDAEGELWNIVVGAVVGGLVSATTELMTAAITGEKINRQEFWGNVAIGAISGGLAATGIVSPALVDAISGGLSSLNSNARYVASGEMSLGEAAVDMVANMAIGAVVGGISPSGTPIVKPNVNPVRTIGRSLFASGTVKNNARQACSSMGKRFGRFVMNEALGSTVISTGALLSRGVFKYYKASFGM